MKRTTSTKSIQPPTQLSSRPSEDEIRKMLATAMAEMKDQQEIPVVPSPKPVSEPKPKRQLSEKQLAALAAGRAKNPHFKPRNV